MGVGILNYAFAIPAFFLIDRFGRRVSSTLSSSITSASQRQGLILALTIRYQKWECGIHQPNANQSLRTSY